jgi:hypothetical protein
MEQTQVRTGIEADIRKLTARRAQYDDYYEWLHWNYGKGITVNRRSEEVSQIKNLNAQIDLTIQTLRTGRKVSVDRFITENLVEITENRVLGPTGNARQRQIKEMEAMVHECVRHTKYKLGKNPVALETH